MPGTRKRILYVKDNADFRDMIRLLLKQEGHEIVTASSVADALELAETRQFDLYILDNWFEQGSGLDLCRQIRRFDSQTPIFFCSGVGQESEIQEALASGAQAYLVKPTNFDRLLQLIAAL